MTIAEITPTRESGQSLAALKAQLKGELITPDAEAYEQARKVVDLTVDRRPAAIVKALDTDDVVTTINYAREQGFTLAVRSGGHSVPGHSTVDDGIVLDLSTMKNVSIDSARGTARVQPGATSGDLAGPAHAYGLALTTGDTSSVGLGGLATGGGIGFMVRRYGLAIDHLLSATVVTAAGEVLIASRTESPDLFWAIRGGGGNFGVITEFEFQLDRVGQVLGGALLLPASAEVIRGYLDYVVQAPEDLTTITNLMLAPPAPFVPEDRVGELSLMIFIVWSGDMADGEKAVAPLRALAEPIADLVSPIPYPAIYDFTAEAAQPAPMVVRSMFSHEVSDQTIEDIVAAYSQPSSPMNLVQFRGLGGAMARVPRDATAFAHRDKPYLTLIVGLWEDPSEDITPHQDWVLGLWEKIRRDADGVYVNFLDDEGRERLNDAYTDATLSRLTQIKAKYDPTNFFRLNQNVEPAAS